MNYRVYIDKVLRTVIEVEADSESAAEDLAIDIVERDQSEFELSHYEIETEELD